MMGGRYVGVGMDGMARPYSDPELAEAHARGLAPAKTYRERAEKAERDLGEVQQHLSGTIGHLNKTSHKVTELSRRLDASELQLAAVRASHEDAARIRDGALRDLADARKEVEDWKAAATRGERPDR